MFAAARHALVHTFTTLAVLLGMVALGFGHHLKTSDAPLDAATLAFVEAGGLLSDICDEGTGDHAGLADCPVCQLAGGLMLPAPLTHCAKITLSHSDALWPRTDIHPVQHHSSGANSSRAPPRA